ncbi:MAG: hypothetical protein C0446_14580 [Chitinophaga sp.]|nr:hypothetical protein [Chitinophaga sp.]
MTRLNIKIAYLNLFFAFLIFNGEVFASENYHYITKDWCDANFNNKRNYSPCISLNFSMVLMKTDPMQGIEFMNKTAKKNVEVINQSAYLQKQLIGKIGEKTKELMLAYIWWYNKVSESCLEGASAAHQSSSVAMEFINCSSNANAIAMQVELYDDF